MVPELEQIKSLLLHEWDPIGVSGVPEAADEYDAYALQIFTSLHSGANPASVKDYLEWVVTEQMGLPAIPEQSEGIAERLFALHHGRNGS